MKNKYPQYGIKTTELIYCPVKLVSYFDKSIKQILPMWGKTMIVDNTKSRQILGVVYHSPQEAIVAMAESLMDAGKI